MDRERLVAQAMPDGWLVGRSVGQLVVRSFGYRRGGFKENERTLRVGIGGLIVIGGKGRRRLSVMAEARNCKW